VIDGSIRYSRTKAHPFITSFDSASSSFLDVQIINPFSTSPSIQTEGTSGALGIGSGYPGPFDHDGAYSISGATLTISHPKCARALAACADRRGRSPISACAPPALDFPEADRKLAKI